MNILAPVDSSKEARMLMKAGATELFCGYIPEDWLKRYQIIEGEHIQSKKKADLLSVSLNKRNNIEGNITDLEEYIGLILKIGVYGFIVTDTALIHFIHKRYPEAVIVLSCCNQVANTDSAEFFRSLGAGELHFHDM